MRCLLALVLLGVTMAVAGQDGVVKERAPVGAGWISVFPLMGNYGRTFKAPVVNQDKKDIYQQSAVYDWLGGDFRHATATLARDPGFKKAHAAETLKALGAKEIEIGKKIAWLLPAGKQGPIELSRIIVPLGEDTALIVEGGGAAHRGFPTELAGRFDAERCAAALQQPPRTDFSRNLDAFRALKKGMSFAEVSSWIGQADKDVGSGIHIMEYRLKDNARVLIGFPTFDRLIYVKHEKDGKTEDLVK